MSLETNTKKPIKSHDDLIEIIDQTGIKHELIDGKIIMMSGGSKRHSEISLNLAIILKSSLKDTDCKVYNSDVKLVVKKEHNHNYYFPDVSVECNESINDKDSVLENPFILAEVLSDSTASINKVKKLNDYLTIPNLKGYLIISQKVKLIELWKTTGEVETLISGDTVEISEEIKLKVDEVYNGISL